MTALPDGLRALLERPSPCLIATTDPDGSPQLTQTWVDTDGSHILINTVRGFRKVANVARDPRVAVSVLDPDQPARYYSVRGTVVATGDDAGREHIERLSRKYTGGPYQDYGASGKPRVVLTIRVDAVVHEPMTWAGRES